jgi:hypothetical protein
MEPILPGEQLSAMIGGSRRFLSFRTKKKVARMSLVTVKIK